jgi:oxygen-independent coproporphyrinogen-3 oxidase
MRWAGVDRISLGIQTHDPNETRTLGRIQTRENIEQAVSGVRKIGFPVLNIDLIYGIPGQTPRTWMTSLEKTCRYEPEEIYIYPLYVRRLTEMMNRRNGGTDIRAVLYRMGRDFLLSRGYDQVSMRMFRKTVAARQGRVDYCCQEDGMIGLGVSARSYTRTLHYATPYGVRPSRVRGIIEHFINQVDYAVIDHGIRLNSDEQRRRYVIKTILRCNGVDRPSYRNRFGTDVMDDFPDLHQWDDHGYLDIAKNHLRLTAAGLERSDVLGPSLFSDAVSKRMDRFPWDLA